MSLKDTQATAKNIEGKIQETVRDLTGDSKVQIESKEKQAEAKVRHATEDVKDTVKEKLD
ncbi:MAG: CsbD family protein [Thermosynechococcaceae cyanobacterium]